MIDYSQVKGYKTEEEMIKDKGLHQLKVTYSINGRRKEVIEHFASYEDFRKYAYMMGYSYSKVEDQTEGIIYYPKITHA